jgi:glutaconate CoA-transferase subunit A
VVATVERIVPNSEVASSPERTMVRGALVVETPWGAHPGGVAGRYVPDLEHYRGYVTAGEACLRDDPGPYRSYLERDIYGAAGHEGYVKTIGARHLEALSVPPA